MQHFSLILTIALLSSIPYAKAENDSCRELVVAAYSSIGETIDKNSFSSKTFEELNLDTDEFNIMDSRQQEVIYLQLKPLATVASDTKAMLKRYIERFEGTQYAVVLAEDIKKWKLYMLLLTKCSN